MIIRILKSAITFVAVGFFSYWLVILLVVPDGQGALAEIISVLVALIAAYFIWPEKGSAESGPFTAAACGAILLGSLAFVGGFFGPLILAPGANQGPLLGIFITGPLGFLVGGVVGVVWWRLSRRQDHDNQ